MLHFFNRTAIFEWCVIMHVSTNGHHNDTCLKEIGLHAQNMITILDSIGNVIGGDLDDHLMSSRIFTIDNE
jgi:hypothetical protein